MLKFRVTNSTKARRAAEAQRRAVEEKLQMEWAWKPMAAMMNEDKTDLVYWIPPLYSSNLMAPGVPRRQSLSRAYTQAAARQSQRSCAPPSPRQAGFSRPYAQLSPRQASFRSYGGASPRQASFSRAYGQGLPRQGSFTRAYAQASPRQGSFSRSYAQAAASQRKKKLATRRTKMTMEDCCQQDPRVNNMMMGAKDERLGKDEDNESGIHDASNEELGHHSLQVPEQHFRQPELQRATFGHPKIRRTSSKLKRAEKESIVRRHSDSAVKSKTLPSVMKLLEKVSHFHTLPSAKKSGGKKFLTRELESRCYGSKKVKRPSVKVYNTPTLSTRRAKPQEEDPRYLFPDGPKVGPDQDMNQQAKFLSGDSPKVRHAHLQMILRLLAQMYEEKVVHQDTQIQQLKNKVQAQEKHMKRMAHMLLHLKEEVTRMKGLRLQRDLQGNILSVKVGEEGKTGIDV